MTALLEWLTAHWDTAFLCVVVIAMIVVPNMSDPS